MQSSPWAGASLSHFHLPGMLCSAITWPAHSCSPSGTQHCPSDRGSLRDAGSLSDCVLCFEFSADFSQQLPDLELSVPQKKSLIPYTNTDCSILQSERCVLCCYQVSAGICKEAKGDTNRSATMLKRTQRLLIIMALHLSIPESKPSDHLRVQMIGDSGGEHEGQRDLTSQLPAFYLPLTQPTFTFSCHF